MSLTLYLVRMASLSTTFADCRNRSASPGQGQWHRGRPTGKAQMGEDADDHGEIFDDRDDLQGSAPVRAMLDVEGAFR